MDQMKGFMDGGYVNEKGALMMLGPGEVAGHVRPSQLDRIEAKLDALLDALAEDDDEQEAGVDLDGNAVGGERDEGETL